MNQFKGKPFSGKRLPWIKHSSKRTVNVNRVTVRPLRLSQVRLSCKQLQNQINLIIRLENCMQHDFCSYIYSSTTSTFSIVSHHGSKMPESSFDISSSNSLLVFPWLSSTREKITIIFLFFILSPKRISTKRKKNLWFAIDSKMKENRLNF